MIGRCWIRRCFGRHIARGAQACPGCPLSIAVQVPCGAAPSDLLVVAHLLGLRPLGLQALQVRLLHSNFWCLFCHVIYYFMDPSIEAEVGSATTVSLFGRSCSFSRIHHRRSPHLLHQRHPREGRPGYPWPQPCSHLPLHLTCFCRFLEISHEVRHFQMAYYPMNLYHLIHDHDHHQ